MAMETCSGLHFLQGWTLDLAACSPASAVAAFVVFVACTMYSSSASIAALAVKLPYKQRQRHTYNTRALLAIASSLTKTTTTMTASLNTYFSSPIPMALVIKGRHTIFVVKVENVL